MHYTETTFFVFPEVLALTKHLSFFYTILTVSNPSGSTFKIQNLTTSSHFHHESPTPNDHHLLPRFPAPTTPQLRTAVYSPQSMMLSTHLPSCYRPAWNPPGFPISLLKPFKMARMTWLHSPSPASHLSAPTLHSSDTPSTHLLWGFCTNCSLCMKTLPRETHIALSFRSLLTCHLVTLFKIANSTPTPRAPYRSLTHLTFFQST